MRQAVHEVFARPEYQWVQRRRSASWIARTWADLIDWLNRMETQHPVGYNIGLALIVVALVVLLVHIGYVIWRILRPAARTGAGSLGPGAASGVMDAAAHERRAVELAREGRYADAIAHRFAAVILELDRRKTVRFHIAKTPAEYVHEARVDDTSRASLAGLVAQLYRHLFGAVPADAAAYAAFGAAADGLLRGNGAAPA